jgi:hypothetical protein
MKLTWFGGTTIRIHIGGKILVADPSGIGGVDPGELVSGADTTFRLTDTLPVVDPKTWRPRRSGKLQERDADEAHLWRIGERSVLVDAVDEPPLLLNLDSVFTMGRWEREAVVVLFLSDIEAVHQVYGSLVDDIAPRLVALAGDDAELDSAIGVIGGKLDATLVALEAGMALEV